MTEEFKEKVKEKHAKRIVVKDETDDIINLVSDEDSATENPFKRNSKKKNEHKRYERVHRKPSRFL